MADTEANLYSPPATTDQPPAPVEPDLARNNPGRLRLAAILLLVNAVLAVLERAMMASQPNTLSSPLSGVAPIVIDALIAVSFLKGNDRYRGFAIFRVVAGTLIFSGLNISHGDYIGPISMVVGYGGLLLVLIGQPRRPRMIVGTVLFGLLVVLELIGLVALGARGE